MLLHYALIVAVVLQIVAVVFVVSLFRSTKYNSFLILLSILLFVMALRRIFDFLVPDFRPQSVEILETINGRLGVLISVLMVIGVFFMRKVLHYLFRIEKIKAENEQGFFMLSFIPKKTKESGLLKIFMMA